MTAYTLYLGCMIPMRFASTELAARYVFDALGAELVDLEGYTCCPDPVLARLTDDDFSLALSARNLAMAEKLGNDLVVLCNGCYETLVEAAELLEDENTRRRVNAILARDGIEYSGNVRVRAFIDVLNEDFTPKEIKARVKEPRSIKVACHTGCHMLRGSDDPVGRTRILEGLVDLVGAEHLAYGREMDCCGFPVSVTDEKLALTTVLAPKLRAMADAGAELIVSGCPTCVYQFENGQISLKRHGHDFSIPVMHLLELMALAFGHSPDKMGLELHRGGAKQLALDRWGGDICD